MLVYFYMGEVNINRIVIMVLKINLICVIDNIECVKVYSEVFFKLKIECKLFIIVDCGLYCFGVELEKVVEFVIEIFKLENIKIVGISLYLG